MTFLEIVTLRSSLETLTANLVNHLETQLRKDMKNKNFRFEFYRNTEISGDLSIHITWINQNKNFQKTILGIRLAQAFNEYGLVSHTLWQKAEKKAHRKTTSGELV